MTVAVIGGLVTSTVLSLVYVPVALSPVRGVELWLAGRTSGPDPVTGLRAAIEPLFPMQTCHDHPRHRRHRPSGPPRS